MEASIMEVERVTDTIHKLTFSLYDDPDAFTVNMAASVGEDGILMVDAGWAPTADQVEKELRKLSDGRVKLIIVTHPHGDHYGGVGRFREQATVIAYKDAKDELEGRYYGLPALPGQACPTILLEDELSLCFNGEEIRIIPAPGHTHSDIVVYFVDSGVVCMGDLIFSDSYPGVDSSRGGDLEQYIESIAWLIDQFPPNVKLLAGHGRDYTMDDLREHYRMAVAVTALIKEGLAAGKNAQQMTQEGILGKWDERSIPDFTTETWIGQACDSLQGKARGSIAEPLSYTIVDAGVEAAIEQYHVLKDDHADAYNFGENELNMLGYQLLWREMIEEAIEIFKLNVQVYPQSENPYDSLGEAYMLCGEAALAIENYEIALALNPDMPSAMDALEKLKSADED
jgi:glyoxylase-like metal-dependent hydrolase (beta-lactamase superfamily II)